MSKRLRQRVCCYLLTIPRNLPSAKETVAHLVSCGLPEPVIFINSPVANPTHINQIHRNIFEGHFSQIEQFYLNQLRENRGLHMIGFEDDVRVIEPDKIVARLLDLLDYLEAHRAGKWTMVNLGCAALGPAFPIRHGLAVVTASYSLQGYLINGNDVPWILSLTREICDRPYVFEGGRLIPFGKNLAMLRPLMTQIRLPKEFFFKDLPVIRDYISYDSTMDFLMLIACLAPLVLILAVIRLFVGRKW